MSFKRDGDDPDQLSVLRKRRVQELFAENIPDNEAHLLSNGRFACTVCYHAPVFDTIYMLSMHRKGKKHKLYDSDRLSQMRALSIKMDHLLHNTTDAERKEQEQREVQEIIEKRRHEQFIQNGTTYVQQAENKFSNKSFITTAPYDPRAKRTKWRPNDRKLRLVVDDSSMQKAAGTAEANPDHSMAPQYNSDLPEQSGQTVPSRQQRMCGYQMQNSHASINGPGERKYNSEQRTDPQASHESKPIKRYIPFESPIMHGKQLSKIFEPPRVDFPREFRPYTKKSGSSSRTTKVSTIRVKEITGHNVEKPAETSSITTPSCLPLDASPLYSEQNHHKTDMTLFCAINNNESSNQNNMLAQPSSGCDIEPCTQHCKTKRIDKAWYTVNDKSRKKTCKCHTKKRKQENHGSMTEVDHSEAGAPSAVEETSAEKLEKERKQKSEKYFQLLGAGWKKDFLGNWIRDENAEFDSDDEHPEV